MAVDPEVVLDDAGRARLIDRFGDGVWNWCAGLPALVDELVRRWDLRLVAALPGNTGRTFRCVDAAGAVVVLKVTPEREIAATEAAALRVWAGVPRVVRLLAADVDAGAVLLEGLEPGTELWSGGVRLAQIGELLSSLRAVPAPVAGFGTLAERLDMIFGLYERRLVGSVAEGRVSVAALRRSRRLAGELAASGETRLLHGDLHPGNVLDAGPVRGAVAIDPRPCLGDPVLDAVDWVFLPMRTGASMEEGIEALVAVSPGLDVERLRAWCRATAVLAAISSLRPGDSGAYVDALLRLVP